MARRIWKELVQAGNAHLEWMGNTGSDSDSESLSFEELGGAGVGIQDMACALYQRAQEHDSNNDTFSFFPNVVLDRFGGLRDVSAAWSPQKYLWCLVYIGQCILNTLLLWSLNSSILLHSWRNLQEHLQVMVAEGDVRDWMDLPDHVRYVHEASSNRFANRTQHLTSISDPTIRSVFIQIAGAIAIIELGGVVFFCCFALKLIVRFVTNGGFFNKSEYRAYQSVDKLVSYVIPTIGTFSALKLSQALHPTIMAADLTNAIDTMTLCGRPLRYAFFGQPLVWIWIIISRLVLFAIALGAFGVKVVIIGHQLTNPAAGSWLYAWAQAAALLNACIGSIPLAQQLQDRIFLFIFGGKDGVYQDDERVLLEVYRCSAMKRIWVQWWQERRERLATIAFLVTFDHYDLQTLIISER